MAWNSRQATVIALGLPLFLIAVFLGWYSWHSSQSTEHEMRIDSNTIHVSIADTESLRELGLGGRSGLSPDEGMLFIFPNDGMYAFWMKDMKFSIDMLWIARDGTIVYIAPNVAPETYPKTFISDKPAAYVLELPAGYATAHAIKVGDSATI